MNICIEHRTDEKSKEILNEVTRRITSLGHQLVSDHPDLVITIGGDGTMLHAIHTYLEKNQHPKFVGIHTGTLGFFTDYESTELDAFFNDFNQKPKVNKVRLLEADIEYNDGRPMRKIFALNEIRVENILQTQLLDVYIDDAFLERFRGNGLCVSGQIGSTAYNRSIQGAIIDDSLEAIQLTEISGIHHKHYRSLNSPLILNAHKEVVLRSDTFEKAMMVYDHLYIDLFNVKKVSIHLSQRVVKFARFRNYSYFARLRNLF